MILAVIAVIALLIYFHIFWWTVLGLIVLIVVLLHFSVAVHLKASRSEGFSITAKWLFITFFPRKKSPKKGQSVQEEPPDTSVAEFLDSLDTADDDSEPDDAEDENPEDEDNDTDNTDDADDEDDPSEAEDDDVEEIDGGDKKSKKKKPKKEKRKKEKGEKKPGKIAAIKQKFDMVKPYIPIGWRAVKKFCKAIRFEGVRVRADVGRFDAHEAAIYYGIAQKIVFGVLEKIALFFTLKLKQADVNCHFGENMIDGEAELTVRVRPSALIAIAFCTGINFVVTFLRERSKRKKAAKAQAAAA